jgi:transposase
VSAAAGRDRKTTEKFLDLLGEERCKQLRLVSCDMAEWITRPVAERCPNATICYDPVHLVTLATDALEDIRREVWNDRSPPRSKAARPRAQGRPVRTLE